jgi:hypothetical protein
MGRLIEVLKDFYYYSKNYRISILSASLILTIISLLVGFGIWEYSSRMKFPVAEVIRITPRPKPVVNPEEKWHFNAKPFSMNELKTKGCVADGLLSGYGGATDKSVALINRSNCIYLHRALESWGNPPNFKFAEKTMEKITKTKVVYGMFLAEDIRKNANLYFPDKDRDFKFGDMCRGHTDNRWGEHTCIPSFEKEEYRQYIQYVTRRAMDMGIQSFMFGQIYLQDTADDIDHSKMYEIVQDMRDYAKSIGLQIVIGAQTNNIRNEKYLKTFDYIEGGVGIDSQGNIENGPCWSKKESCWGLLWHPDFSGKANNVFLHLDWSGLLYDDMSTFARMDQDTRARTLKNLYTTFTQKNMGFMMPMLAILNKTNSGCYGPKKSFYSPDNKYSCKDENIIDSIMTASF